MACKQFKYYSKIGGVRGISLMKLIYLHYDGIVMLYVNASKTNTNSPFSFYPHPRLR